MAEKGLTVRLKTDNSDFKKGMDEVVEELNKYNKALIDNQYKQKDANKAISEAQREIKNLKKAEEDRAKQLENEKKRREELNKIIDDTNEELNRLDSIKSKDGQLSKEQEKLYKSLSNTMQKAFQELDKLTMTEEKKTKLDEDGKKKIEELNGTIESQKLQLSQLRVEQVNIKSAITEASKAAVEEGQAIDNTTETVKESNEHWTTWKATLANLTSDVLKKLASQIVSIGKDVIQTGEQFSASMSEVGAISGATAEELSELEQTARLYGSTTKFSATEAADALKYMALAGWNSQQAIAGLPAVLDLAAASGMDLGRASDIVTDYITAFGLAAEDSARFVDIMSYAMSHSNTTTEMLGDAYKNCAATAKSMGFSVEEVTAALMTMANAGVKGGEAGTTLNTLMTRLATNTKGCADELSKYGVEIYDSQGKMHSLSEIMSGLISVFQSLNQEQQANLSKMIAGINQYSGFQTLMQGMSDAAKAAGMSFEDYTAALQECDGASSDMAKTMSDNLTGDLKALQSALDELKLKIFDDAETPLRNLVKLTQNSVIPAIDGIIKNLNVIIPTIVGAATAMGTLKASLAISTFITNLKKAFDGLTLSQIASTVAAKGFKAALQELKTEPVIALLSVFTTLVSVLSTVAAMNQNTSDSFENSNTKAKNYLGTLQNLKAEADKRIEDIQVEGKVLKNLQDEYDNLRKQTNLTADEKSHLDTVANELAKTLGISTQALKDKNGAYIEITGSVDEYIKKLQEQAVLENASDGIKESYLAYNKAKKAVQDYNKQIQEQQEIVDDNAKHVENLQKHLDEDFPIHNFYYYGALNELNDAKKELESQKSILNDLKGVQAGYQTQMITATGSAIEYKKALGQVVDEEKEWEQCGKDMNSTAEETAKTFSKLNQAENDNTEVTETATKKTETLSEKYKRLNGLLEENQKAVKAVNDEIEEAMDSGDTAHIEELQSRLKDLNAENTTLKNRIKAVTDEINKAANAIADAIENVENSMQMLKKAEKEVADNGKLSLNTLMSIQKKYPELIDLTNQYIEGVKTEKDVIAGLKEVYEKDADNYNQALAFKKLKQDSYNSEFASASAELVNKYQEHYGIDLKNFISVNEAKKAALDELKAKADQVQQEFDDFWADNNFDIDMTNGNMNYIAKDSVTNQWRQATNAEIARYNEILARRDKAFDNYYNFDENAFQTKLEEDLKKYYSPVSADSLLTLGGSSSNSSGSGNQNQNTVTLSGDGVTASGNTYTQAYMTWIDRMKALGKMSDQSEIYHLEQLKKRTDNTAEEIYQIDLKLYNARKKIAEDNAKTLADIEKKRQDELQEKLNLAKSAYDRLVNGRIESLQKEAQTAKDTANAEIAALDKVLAKRKQARADEDRQKKIDYINAQLRYKQLDDFSRKELQRQKQDLLSEQADYLFEQNISAKKDNINSRLDLAQNKSQQAINGLNSAKSQFADHIAYLSGNQSYDQRVSNNTTNQNVQIIQNGLNGDQVVAKLLKALGAV